NLDELNAAAGAAIARMLGAEAAFVTSGASSGLILQAAACIAGDDPTKITRLPDTRGMRNEIVIQRAHRFAYDQAYRVAGGDLVSFSGGKGIRGPQSTGILAGRRDLVRAVALNASPNQALGRAAKTSKEEICGLVTALECFMAEDEKAEMKRYTDVCATIVETLDDIPGLRAVVEQDPVNRVLPHAVVYFTPD